jgi:hypothetical protein
MTMGTTAMIDDHGSGNFSGVDDAQAGLHAVRVAKRRLALEQERNAFLTEKAVGVAGCHVATVASEDLADVPPPTTLMTNSGALFVKNALVHFSLSTLRRGSLGK